MPTSVLVGLPKVGPCACIGFVHVDGAAFGRIPAGGQTELAEDAEVDWLISALPEEAAGRDGEGVAHVPCVAAWGRGESALHIVADESLHEPVMSVKADGAAGMEVIEE